MILLNVFSMAPIFLAISTVQFLNILGVVVLLILGLKYLESFWSYKISKPYAWERAVSNGTVPKALVKMERIYRDKVRFYNFWFQIARLKRVSVKGAFAELGVHKGTTAKAIHLMDPNRAFYLFDTFSGFSSKDLSQEEQEGARFTTEMFADTSQPQVEAFINGNENLRFRAGYFPETSIGLEDEQFAFVHLDADLYAPTIEALRFFYPRLSPGGVIIIHDYNHNWEGIPKALHEFKTEIPESLVELTDWQGSVMIIKNG
jgi:O-methyltransferase